MKLKPTAISCLYFIVTALILCVPAFYNRYVLFYTDSALYLESAMNLIPSIDRPMGYSFFIRVTTCQTSLWMTIFFQGLTATLLIYHALKTLLANVGFKKLHHFLTICFLTFFSSLGWYVSLLMPDILSSFLIIAVFNVVMGKNNIITYVFYAVLIFFIILSHLSNIPLLAVLLILIWLFLVFKKNRNTLKRKVLLGTMVIVFAYLVTLLFLIGYNKKHYDRPSLSPTGSIFFFARLIDTGVIDTYLKDKCNEKDFRICQYKDSLPQSSQFFLWHTDGIFYKMGGWNNYQAEPKQIVKDILTSPKYYKALLWDFSISTVKQLFTFKVGGDFYNFVDGSWSPVYDKCLKSFPSNEMKRDFRYTRQAKEEFNFDTLNDVIYLVVFLSLLLIVIVLNRYTIDEKIFYFLVISILGIIANAAICANLSNVLNRYQARVVWIIPFVAIVLFLNYIYPNIKVFLSKPTQKK